MEDIFMNKTKTPTYGELSDSPAGMNFKYEIDGRLFGNIQGHRIEKYEEGIEGELTFIAFMNENDEDRNFSQGNMVGKEVNLKIGATIENKTLVILDDTVKFTRYHNSTSINDIVTEYLYNFIKDN